MRSNLTAGAAALALVFTLSACDDLDQALGIDKSGSNTTTTTSTTTNTTTTAAVPGTPPAKPATSDPALEAEIQAGVAQARSTLPIRIDQVTQVVDIRADGTELVYDVSISQPIPGGSIATAQATFQRMNQAALCANPQLRTLIARGGSLNHRYSDTGGNRFETRVVSCS